MAKKNTQAEKCSSDPGVGPTKRTCQEIAGELWYICGEIHGVYHKTDRCENDDNLFGWSSRLSELAEELMSVEATA